MEETDNCGICLDPMQLENSDGSPILIELYTLKCNHQFHKDCISRWLAEQTTCPLCRTNVDPIPQYVDDGIMSEERRQELIEIFKSLMGDVGELMETMMPNYLGGFGEHLNQQVQSGEYNEVLGEIVNKYSLSGSSSSSSENQGGHEEISLIVRMFKDMVLYGLNLE